MSVAYDFDVLSIELRESSDSPRRVLAIAGQMAVLAHRLHQQEGMMIPAHLRATPRDLPSNVTHMRSRRGRA
jgi:hypothetical protein